MTAKLYVIRHGNTAMNSRSVIRGWSNPPLDAEGKSAVHALAKNLAAKHTKIDVLASSDLDRAVESAKIVGGALGVKQMLIDWNFRPWDVGDLTGSDSNKATKELDKYIQEPGKKVPNGESFGQFRDRFMRALSGLLSRHEGQDVLIVTHHRGERLIASTLRDNLHEMDKEGIPPAGMVVYSHKGGKIS